MWLPQYIVCLLIIMSYDVFNSINGVFLILPPQEQQLDLLGRVLTAGIEEAGVEVIRDDDGDRLAAVKGAGQAARRNRWERGIVCVETFTLPEGY